MSDPQSPFLSINCMCLCRRNPSTSINVESKRIDFGLSFDVIWIFDMFYLIGTRYFFRITILLGREQSDATPLILTI